MERTDRTCPMCSHRIINPGLAPEYSNSFDSDDESSDPVEDEHDVNFDGQAMPMPMSFFLTFSRAISAQSAIFSISHNAIGWRPSF